MKKFCSSKVLMISNMKLVIAIIYICLNVSCSKPNEPNTFLINSKALVANKQKIKANDSQLLNALTQLKQLADAALEKGPYSVTSKKQTPPSGDKHDYMSMGPYWWPDPSKPDGLPYIRRDGERNPEINELHDAEYIKTIFTDVRLLSLAYYFTEDNKYADKAIELLNVWFLDEATLMNPNLNYAQSIPGITEGRGIGIIDTRGLVHLIDGIQILKSSNQLSQIQYDGLQTWFGEYLHWLLTSPNGIDEADEHNNHGTYYDIQAIAMALFVEKTDEAVKVLNEKTKARIDSQLELNGSQPHELARTLSWTYSQMNLEGFFQLAALSENVNIDLWNYVSPSGKSIKQAFFWMLPYAQGKPWEYKQLNPANQSTYLDLSRIAVVKYPNQDLANWLTKQNDKTNSLFILTN